MSHSCQSDREEQTVAWLTDEGRDNDRDKKYQRIHTVFASSDNPFYDGNLEKEILGWNFQFTPETKANKTSINLLPRIFPSFVALIRDYFNKRKRGLPSFLLTPWT